MPLTPSPRRVVSINLKLKDRARQVTAPWLPRAKSRSRAVVCVVCVCVCDVCVICVSQSPKSVEMYRASSYRASTKSPSLLHLHPAPRTRRSMRAAQHSCWLCCSTQDTWTAAEHSTGRAVVSVSSITASARATAPLHHSPPPNPSAIRRCTAAAGSVSAKPKSSRCTKSQTRRVHTKVYVHFEAGPTNVAGRDFVRTI